MNGHDPLEQLAGLRVEVDADVRDRDLAAIGSEIRRIGNPVPRRRRWTSTLVVATIVAVPAAALASDSALPGDVLYPVKLAVEPVVRVFDGDVVAEHRVEEVTGLIARDADDAIVEDRIAAARAALASTDAPELERDLENAVDRWTSGDGRDADRPPVTDVEPPVTTTVPARDTPTTAPIRDGETDRPDEPAPDSTTTVPERPTDETTTDGTPGSDGDDGRRPSDRRDRP